MAKLTKRMREIAEKVDADKVFGIEEAVGLLNELSKPSSKNLSTCRLISVWTHANRTKLCVEPPRYRMVRVSQCVLPFCSRDNR